MAPRFREGDKKKSENGREKSTSVTSGKEREWQGKEHKRDKWKRARMHNFLRT